MSNILQLLIHSNTLNFIIVLAILIFLVIKLNLKEKIELLKEEIKDYVEASYKEKAKAEQDLAMIKEKIEELPKEIENIKESAENSVKSIGDKIRLEAVDKKQDIANNAERIFNLETKKFKQKLTTILSEKSVEIARENALNQLIANKDLHNKYIDTAIEELDRISL